VAAKIDQYGRARIAGPQFGVIPGNDEFRYHEVVARVSTDA
jgi:hypothetical protein